MRTIVLTCLLAALLATLSVSAQDEPPQPAPPTPAELIDGGSWTMVVLPDIQSYVDHSARYPLLEQIVQWIVDNRESCNIQLVLQVGDIVFQNGVPLASMSSGDQNSHQQWTNAQRALHRLNGVVPYILATGNHDYGLVDADGRFTQFNDFFRPTDNPLVDPAQGGILAELGPNAYGNLTLENACYDFTAPDGRGMLILALEWGPRQAAVDWALEVASREQYRDHTKVLVTHAYLYPDDTRYDWAAKGAEQAATPHAYSGTSEDTNDGEELWNELVRITPGFELVFCGHVGGDMVGYLASENDHGDTVHQLLFNAQFLPLGGEGWIRLLEFTPDGETVRVRTYSPYFAQDNDPETAPWRTAPDDDFSIQLSPVDPD